MKHTWRESEPTSGWSFLAREFGEPMRNGKQMVDEAAATSSAPITQSREVPWDEISWKQTERRVYRLQMRIAKAIEEKRYNKVKALQWMLTHSLDAKRLAVKRVTDSSGARTAGIDGVKWKTSKQKEEAVNQLKRRGYKAQPLKRVYIPKRNGKLRPLGIPTMKDRAMQALYLLGLEPVAEMQADPNAYGFRPMRSTADAIAQCFNVLARKGSATWILEGDIRACFDNISHDWLMANVQTDKAILQKWLKAGHMENRILHPTSEGTPQGGIISPCLAVITLSGLEKAIKKIARGSDKVNVVAYADDFIITGASKEVLEERIKPAVIAFLKERNLDLSEEKTKITAIEEGFDFLGFNVRKYKGTLLIKPSKRNVKMFLEDVRETIRRNVAAKTENLIRLLNPKILGWANYYRHAVAKQTFYHVDGHIFRSILRWINRRHPNKNWVYKRKKYFCTKGLRNWIFFGDTSEKDASGKSKLLYLAQSKMIPIRRHIKIRAEAHPYNKASQAYVAERLAQQGKRRRPWELTDESSMWWLQRA